MSEFILPLGELLSLLVSNKVAKHGYARLSDVPMTLSGDSSVDEVNAGDLDAVKLLAVRVVEFAAKV